MYVGHIAGVYDLLVGIFLEKLIFSHASPLEYLVGNKGATVGDINHIARREGQTPQISLPVWMKAGDRLM